MVRNCIFRTNQWFFKKARKMTVQEEWRHHAMVSGWIRQSDVITLVVCRCGKQVTSHINSDVSGIVFCVINFAPLSHIKPINLYIFEKKKEFPFQPCKIQVWRSKWDWTRNVLKPETDIFETCFHLQLTMERGLRRIQYYVKLWKKLNG